MTAPTQNGPVVETSPRPASSPQPGSKPEGRRRVSVSVINFWIDVSLLVLLLVLGWVSAVLQFVFPALTAAAGWSLWGLGYDRWHDVQFTVLCLFAAGIVLHLMMHWNWVCSVIATQIVRARQRPDEGMQTIYGVATLIVLLHLIGAGVIAAMLCVHQPPL
jgi:hypothetical protein